MNYLVETKKEYTLQLVNIIVTPIYEGLAALYDDARGMAKNDQVLKVFQVLLRRITKWNKDMISEETERIKLRSKCYDWVEDLLKAIIKANIILLTTTSPSYSFKYLDDKTYHNIEFSNFVHRCYVECARQLYDNPYLFYDGYPKIDIQRNRREAKIVIKGAIQEAIRKMLPIKHILREYLGHTYQDGDVNEDFESSISEADINNLKQLINKDLTGDFTQITSVVPKETSVLKSSLLKTNVDEAIQMPEVVNASEELLSQKREESDKSSSLMMIPKNTESAKLISQAPAPGVEVISLGNQIKTVTATTRAPNVGAPNVGAPNVGAPNVGAPNVVPGPVPAFYVPAPVPVPAAPYAAVPVPIITPLPEPVPEKLTETASVIRAIRDQMMKSTTTIPPKKAAPVNQRKQESSDENEMKAVVVTQRGGFEDNSILKRSVYGNVTDDSSDSSIDYNEEAQYESVFTNRGSHQSESKSHISNAFIRASEINSSHASSAKNNAKKKKYFADYTKL